MSCLLLLLLLRLIAVLIDATMKQSSTIMTAIIMIILLTRPGIALTENGAVGEHMFLSVSDTTMLTVSYNITDQAHLPYRIFTHAPSANLSHPVFISIRQGRHITSWTIPYIEDSNGFLSVERTLCPILNSPYNYSNNTSTVIYIDVSTPASYYQSIDILLDHVDNYELSINNSVGITVSAPSPVFYVYEFPDNNNDDDVLVSVTSDSNVCALVSVQDGLCPNDLLLEHPSHRGVHQTMKRLSAITYKRPAHQDFFYIVITILHDSWCTDTKHDLIDGLVKLDSSAQYNPVSIHTGGELYSTPKNITITIKPKLSFSKFWIAPLLSFIIFSLAYIATAVWIIIDWQCFRTQEQHRLFKLLDDIELQHDTNHIDTNTNDDKNYKTDYDIYKDTTIKRPCFISVLKGNNWLSEIERRTNTPTPKDQDYVTQQFNEALLKMYPSPVPSPLIKPYPHRSSSNPERSMDDSPMEDSRPLLLQEDDSPDNVKVHRQLSFPPPLHRQRHNTIGSPQEIMTTEYWSAHSKSITKASDPIIHSPPLYGRKKGVSECLDYKNKVSFQLHGAVSFDNITDDNEESVIVSNPHSHTTEPHSHTTEPHTIYHTSETHNQTLEPHSHALVDQVTPTNDTPTNDTPTNNIQTTSSSEDTPTQPFTEQYSNYDASNNFFVFPQNSNVTLDLPQSPSSPNHISPNHTPPRRHSMLSLTRKSKHFVLEECKMSDLQIPEGKHFQKRYEGYWAYIIAVVLFYALPTYQLLLTYQKYLNYSGNEDFCYYNTLCSHRLGVFSAFNNIWSNIGFLMLGLLFLIIVRRRREQYRYYEHVNEVFESTNNHGHKVGIPQHFGIYYAVGVALMGEAVMSAAYHICPTGSNYQFDTTMMFVLVTLGLYKLYECRNPDIYSRPHKLLLVLSLMIMFIGMGVLYSGYIIFYIAFFVIFETIAVYTSLQHYYRWIKLWPVNRLKEVVMELVCNAVYRPFSIQHKMKFVFTIYSIFLNMLCGIYLVARRPEDFGTYFLAILISNFISSLIYYVIAKLRYRECQRVHPCGIVQPLIYLIVSVLFWIIGIVLYYKAVTNWLQSPSVSRNDNQECLLLGFFDSHDIWHFVSAFALFFSFLLLMTLDDNQEGTNRNKLHIF